MRAPKNRLSGLSTVLRALCAGYLIWHPVLAQAAGQASTFGTGANSFTIDFVTIGNPGNPAYAVTGFGAVGFHYKIMQFEFTNSQYAAFLNSIDPDGTNPNAVYSSSMGTEAVGGIANTGTTKGSHYVIKTNMGDKPVNYVSWWDAARVSNWMQNGAQTYGSTDSSATAPQNTGAYTVGTATSGNAVAVNAYATFYVPTQDQWFKAAYFNPTLSSGPNSYNLYGNGFSTAPALVSADATGDGSAGGTGNFANYGLGAEWNGQNGNVTTVGTNGGASYYGAFDMSGNVWEWNDLIGTVGSNRGHLGGAWGSVAGSLSASATPASADPSYEGFAIGFRLTSPTSVNLLVGNIASNQVVTFTTGTTAYTNVFVGVNAGDDDNSLTVTNAGTLLTSSSNVVVGLSGSGNSMLVSAGGTVVTNSGTYTGAANGGIIGYSASASNNTVTVTGSGSAWNNAYNVVVGYGGSGNSLLVSAGGAVTAGNTAYSATLGYDAGSSNNSVTVTGSGSTFSNYTAIVGLSGTGNSMVVSAGGKVLTGESGSYIGSAATSAGNSVQVTGTGSEWSNGSFLFVGELGSGNTLTVSDGGSVTAGGIDVGYSAGNAGNSVVVSSGGSISSASTYIGRSGSGNSVLVTGSGSTWTNSPTWPSSSAPLTIGLSGTDSSLTVADGGAVTATQTTIAEFAGSSGALNIGRFGNSDAAGTISTPTIAFGAGSGRINFNQANSTTLSSAISGTGSLYQFGSGTTILTAANSYKGATYVNAGTLLINGNQSAANGAVTVAAGARIGGSGTIGGAITVNGILSPGNSPGVLTVASVVLGGSSTSVFEINGAARGTQYDGVSIIADSGLTYGGALSLSFGNASAFGATTFDLFSFTGTPSDNFTSVTSTGFYAGRRCRAR